MDKIDSNYLNYIGMNFLFWRKNCHIITNERGFLTYDGRPDIIGITKDRDVIEIEIKVTMSDFVNNFSKRLIQIYEQYPEKRPNYFYFIVSDNIANKCLDYLKANKTDIKYGLMTFDSKKNSIKVMKNPGKNKLMKPLTDEQIWQMVQYQARTLASISTYRFGYSSQKAKLFNHGEGI